jgi:hypothetical protein
MDKIEAESAEGTERLNLQRETSVPSVSCVVDRNSPRTWTAPRLRGVYFKF